MRNGQFLRKLLDIATRRQMNRGILSQQQGRPGEGNAETNESEDGGTIISGLATTGFFNVKPYTEDKSAMNFNYDPYGYQVMPRNFPTRHGEWPLNFQAEPLKVQPPPPLTRYQAAEKDTTSGQPGATIDWDNAPPSLLQLNSSHSKFEIPPHGHAIFNWHFVFSLADLQGFNLFNNLLNNHVKDWPDDNWIFPIEEYEYVLTDDHQDLHQDLFHTRGKKSHHSLIIKEGRSYTAENWCDVRFYEYINNLSKDKTMVFDVDRQTNPGINNTETERYLSWGIRSTQPDHRNFLFGYCKWFVWNGNQSYFQPYYVGPK